MKPPFHILVSFYFVLLSFNMYCIIYEAVSARLKNLEELKAIMQNQCNNFCQDGFAWDTLIKTPDGYTPIQELEPNDLIINHNGQTCVIEHVSKKLISHYVEITVDDNVIIVAPHQLFYVASNNQWIMAQDLTYADIDSIKNIEHLYQSLVTYTITVENHLFCVSTDDLIVHNMDTAMLQTGVVYLGYIVAINPVVAIVGATLALAKLSHDIYNAAEIKTYINQHCKDNFSISDHPHSLTERYYFHHRKKILQKLLQEFLLILDNVTTLKTVDGSFTFLFLNAKISSSAPNCCLDISLNQEHALDILQKENLCAYREIELQELEQEIIATQLMLGFHFNELIEQKNTAIDAYFKTFEESTSLYKIWHDNLNHISQQTALDLYKRCLIEEHSLHNAQSKMKELKLIIDWYKKNDKCQCLKQTTNIIAELERQTQHILDIEKRMQEEEKQIHANIAEVKKYFDKYRIMIGTFRNEIQLNLEKYQKKENDKLLEDAQAKHKKLCPRDGPKKGDDDKNDKNEKLIYKDSEAHKSSQSGKKSPKPKKGQEALDNSIRVQYSPGQRVAIENDKIVTLQKTQAGKYHGYVNTWEEILSRGGATSNLRATLIKNGLVSKTGKILQ
jgi:hypothetical protein